MGKKAAERAQIGVITLGVVLPAMNEHDDDGILGLIFSQQSRQAIDGCGAIEAHPLIVELDNRELVTVILRAAAVVAGGVWPKAELAELHDCGDQARFKHFLPPRRLRWQRR